MGRLLQALGDALTEARQKDRDAEDMAKRMVIPSPRYSDELLEVFNAQLEEDNPDVHRTLQAMTRLTKPSVSVV